MAQESKNAGFQKELLRFRESLSNEHRELLDELIRAALTEHPAPIFDVESRWNSELAENVLRDIGGLLIWMKDGRRTCGGWCSPYKKDAQGDIFCLPTCIGDVATGCSCHLYSYPTPPKGKPRPRMQDWDHEWAPGEPKITPQDGKTYECVCVK
jgi:hypothetical protein